MAKKSRKKNGRGKSRSRGMGSRGNSKGFGRDYPVGGGCF